MAGVFTFLRRFTERKDNPSLELWRDLYGGRPALSGQIVTWQTALQVTTVLRCASVLADGISTIPLKIYRKTDQGREEASDHPLYDLFGVQANEWQTGLEYRETLAFHTALCGNHYSFINRTSKGISELIPIVPGATEVDRRGDSLVYKVTIGSAQQEFPAEAIWHVRGPSWNGWMGMEPVKLARESIGLALATEEHHARLHKNGARPGGLYSVDGTLDPDQYKRLRAWLEQNAEGADNSYKTLILDRAAKFTSLSMTGVDSQHLETRRFQIEEVCRAMNVLPIMVGHSDKTQTYASAEQMFLAHVVYTMRPWHRRIEASIRKNLLTDKERAAGYYPRFIDTELLRGAAKDRAEYYAKGLGSGGSYGWLTPNDVRELEDMPPHADGDQLPIPPNAGAAPGTDQQP